jgi:hypothetical protein
MIGIFRLQGTHEEFELGKRADVLKATVSGEKRPAGESTGHGTILRWRLLELPAPDHEPNRKDQLHEGQWKKESECVRVKVGLQRIDHPAQSVKYEQNPDDLGEVARPIKSSSPIGQDGCPKMIRLMDQS